MAVDGPRIWRLQFTNTPPVTPPTDKSLLVGVNAAVGLTRQANFGGGGFLSEPWIDEALGGTVLEAFRDGAESGALTQSGGGKWPVVEGNTFGQSTPTASTEQTRSGTHGIRMFNGSLAAGKTWSSSNTATTQAGGKIGVYRSQFDTPSNYEAVSGESVFSSAWYFIPTDYPQTTDGSPHTDRVTISQLKSNVQGGKSDPLLNFFFGTHSGDTHPTIRLRWQIRPGHASSTSGWALGSTGVIPKGQWFNITQKALQHSSAGRWQIWLNGVEVVDRQNIDTTSRFDGSDGVTNGNGYQFFLFNHHAVGSTSENQVIYGDDAQIWVLQ